ncbi:uncharacterized protein TRIADDRAFT_56394 [Trichoplax adhaerens]|uniref:G-protein coupled receptors family 1 profile domain-containing protein n=1 Tax=Trichoplax adhaerens TaxID=10228 RepID=B3RY06_TRIAD|nr:hypothetical protein TRIADDRAFT_56394 [Trichoplax adhaerens]EDV24519.1 hypothetical protein TRIADDRAFT_56394 [Trichoplax adhaerens]|eukprot:XP_002112409.1 hypothetical protein TRIADDRAFT_56394 [Trichoplax adhaerens]
MDSHNYSNFFNVTSEVALSFVVLQPIYFFFGFIGNGAVCVSLLRKWKKLQVNDYFVINLALSDGLSIIGSMISYFPSFIRIYINDIPVYQTDSISCRFNGGIIIYCALVSIYSMMFLAVIRYLKIVRSQISYRLIKGKRFVFTFWVINWVFPLIVVVPPVIGFWISYFPFLVAMTLSCFYSNPLLDKLLVLTISVTYTSSLVNPIIFLINNSRVQKRISGIMGKWRTAPSG